MSKPLDADSDNVLGTDGYAMFHFGYNGTDTNQDFYKRLVQSMPGYVNPAGIAAGTGGGAGRASSTVTSYVDLDDPSETPGPSVLDANSGVGVVTGLTSGNEYELLTFTLQPGLPALGFRLGVLADNVTSFNNVPTSIRISDSAGGNSGQVTVDRTGSCNTADWYFFDIIGASAGDVVSVNLTASAINSQTLGGVIFDSHTILNYSFEDEKRTEQSHFDTDGTTPGPLLDGKNIQEGPEGYVNANRFDLPNPIRDWVYTNTDYNGGIINPLDAQFAGATDGGAPTTIPDGTDNVAFDHGLATISQKLGVDLQPNIQYNLLVDVGDRADFNFAGYRVQLKAGTNVLAEDNNSLVFGDILGTSQWQTSLVSFISPSNLSGFGSDLELEIVLQSLGVQNQITHFDNVRLMATLVPEPSSLVLLGLGLIGLLAYRRRRRRAS